ncbi:response regulator transcription factor [Bacteroidota bacterium]
MERILIIEDEESILMALEDNLQIEGYKVTSAVDGEEGLTRAKENDFDLILLDIMLPKMDGFEVCKQIRAVGINTPIIMLTAKSQEIDKVLGLEFGADDYVTKPFSSRELLARIKALLRRTKLPIQNSDRFNFGDIEVDFQKYEVRKKGELIYLTALEFNLLHFLMENINQVIERDKILDEVWGNDVYVQARTVDKHISELRKKIEDNPANPKYIRGVRSIGYKFVMEQTN